MSICVNCYHNFYHKTEHEVGHLWNIEPYMAAVCSDKCKDEIEKKVTDGTWMVMRSFPKTKNTICLSITRFRNYEYLF